MREPGPVSLEILGRSSVRRVNRGKAKSFGRNSMATDIGLAPALCKDAIREVHHLFLEQESVPGLKPTGSPENHGG
jgi:hypothetical protein